MTDSDSSRLPKDANPISKMASIHHTNSTSSSSASSHWSSTHCSPRAPPLSMPSAPALWTLLEPIVSLQRIIMPKEQYMCQLCANHGIFNQPKKGHKQKCPYRTCPCSLCALNTKRRALDQIERQLKHTNEPMVGQTATSMSTSLPQETDCQVSPRPTTAKTPTLPTPGKETFRNSISNNNLAYTVQLPATITKKELKLLRRDDVPLQSSNPLKRSYPRNLDEAMETISKKERMSSIFHSAEMLALGDAPHSPSFL